MEEEIDIIVNEIENHFKRVVWKSQPPLKEEDYHLLMTALKLIDIKNNINNINVDKEIRQILNYMETEFKTLIQEKHKSTSLITQIYNDISKLRG